MERKPNDFGAYNFSSLGIKAIPNREAFLKTSDQWMKDKRVHDGAEGLWRIHDDLYDLSQFVDAHPGGKFWLKETKGSDITEPFESHHISTKPEEMLKKFHVRKAKTVRNSPFTFAGNGFYRTLKKNVREALKAVPSSARWKSHIAIDSLLLLVFVLSSLACYCWSFSLGVFAGLLLGSTAVAAHNYGHQRDNFRMYYGDIAFLSVRELRMVHVLSHHMYTNTVADMQAYSREPILQLYPNAKSFLAKYGSWIYGPLMFPIIFYLTFLNRIIGWIFYGRVDRITKADFLPLILPCIMYCLSGQPLLETIGMWSVIIAGDGLWYSLVGVAGTHFHPDIFIDGDKPRSSEDMDWGIAQLDTVSDRREFTKVHWLGLITFGDHAMHHLFPAMDHAFFNYLYPVVEETMEKFNLCMRTTNQVDMLSGFFRQLARETPNPNPPNLFVNHDRRKNHLKFKRINEVFGY